ncbi:DUF4139 domain-containing protein [Marinobacterium nitratireducens]|uniref:DUF4139 domain-containing protein n=1 Tax=Marinobacterium nitratireducens TaxID=518897 RepID=A0A918DTV3_9GAMM|nr:DUF4139 domain-containing protein [Marinobacterium nitratireducens]GGO82110.1 DUF4139 domain-containing protein [Marinobacterium nitratireducens]
MPMSFRCLSLLLAAMAAPLGAQTLHIDADARQALTLTVYNQNLGLVRDSRQLPPFDASQTVAIEDVSRRMQTETLSIRGAGSILEQTLNTNLLSHQALLQHYLGRELSLARRNPATGDESIAQVTLLSVEGDRALVRRDERVESVPLDRDWRFIFPQLPPHLISKPSLEFRSNGTEVPATATFSYLTDGLSWQMDYVLNLAENGQQMSLEGLATLYNETGTDFRDASFQLLAGNLNQPAPVAYRKATMEMAAMAADAAPPPEAFQDYHLYSLPLPTSLLDRQHKQLPLISIDALPVTREYRHEFLAVPRPDSQRHKSAPQTWLRFANAADQPLPAGAVRAFAPDSSGRQQFIGGSRIGHTATGQDVEMQLGEAFDLVVERQQTLFQKEYDGDLLEYEVLVRNSGEAARQLQLAVNFTQPWDLQHSNRPMTQSRGGRAEWTLSVPPGDKSMLRFRVKLKKPQS